MSNVLQVENEKSILFHSRIVWDEGCAPLRIVLRKNGNEYITHMEALSLEDGVFKHAGFMYGNYFGQDEKKAMADYQERRAKL